MLFKIEHFYIKFLLIIFVILTSCQLQEPSKNHGIIFLENRSKKIGKNISFFDKRITKKLPKISSVKKIKWKSVDLVFLSMPNGEAQKLVSRTFYKYKNLRYIDLSADFRINNSNIYKQNYEINHKAKKFIKKSLYAVSEFTKREIQYYRIISNPGCYPTSVQLPLRPLIKKGMLNIKNISIASKSGYSGAGKNFEKI